MALDPTKIHVESHAAPLWEREETFQEIMAEQLRHAPWLMLSIVIHGIALFIAWNLLVGFDQAKGEKAIAMSPDQEEELIEPPPPEEVMEEEETEEEPILQDTEVTETTEDVAENFEDLNVRDDFDMNDMSAPIGLGGGGGSGKYGNRKSGRKSAPGGRAQARAIELGLEWLKNHQDEDGMWDADEFMKHDLDGEPCDGAGSAVHDVGVTALALLAFLGDGSDMRSGPYRDVVRKAVGWLREQQGDDGLFGTNASHDFIYDHALATLAMVESFGLSESVLLRRYAQGGINYLEAHRNPYAVWRYQPRDNDNDTSVTGWCVMAYKSAEDFKLNVNHQALDNAKKWFDDVTNPQGQVGYTQRGELSSRHPGMHQSRFPPSKGEAMTAVALLCRFFLGQDPEDKETKMKEAASLILSKPPVWDESDGSIDHYYWYYATYALYQLGDVQVGSQRRPWTTWSQRIEDAVIRNMRENGNYKGSWDPIGVWGEDGGRVYSTAILVLTLEAYYRYSRLAR